MEKYCFYKGEITKLSKTLIGVNDIGLMRGYGVFEVLRTYNREPFFYKKHLDRLRSSALFMGIKVPYSNREILEIIESLIEKLPDIEVSIRIVLTGGETSTGLDFNYDTPTFFIIVKELIPLDSSLYEDGASLFMADYQRIFPKIKTLDYVFSIKNRLNIKNKDFFDILYVSNDKILESSTSNFFLVKNKKIITPSNNILMGITREFVISLAKKQYEVEERDTLVSEIESTDEAFITATTKEILPIIKIGDSLVGNGLVGPITRDLMEEFKKAKKN